MKIKQNIGFTLIEIAIVLIIVGLLISAFLPPLAAQFELRDYSETEAVLEDAKEALIGFAIANQFLPCPDVAAIPTGVEGGRTGDECTVLEGVLPWQVLGVRGVDAWGRYIRYRVSTDFTNSNGVTFFGITDTGDITVNSDTGTLTTSAIAVLVSHGPNGFGGINTVQASPANLMTPPPLTAVDEIENSNVNLTYISHTPVEGPNEFDDTVTWISSTILVNRMVAAGQLP